MSRWFTYLICITFVTLALGCQNKQSTPQRNDPAGDLLLTQTQPVQTPIPSTVNNKPIVITELSPNVAAALSDGMMEQTPQAKPTPKKTKPQVVIIEPDVSNTSPMSHPQLKTQQESQSINKGPSDRAFALRVEKAHGKKHWRSNRCIQADIKVSFGGNLIVDGKILTDRYAGKVRLTLTNGVVLVYDGKEVWMSPANASVKKPRFAALTWAYFIASPFKLNDPGSHLQNMGLLPMGQSQIPAAKLTFSPGVGDTPDDWYIAYVDPKTKWLKAMAYIVTYGTQAHKAEKHPHAITYDNYVNVAGVILPRTWKFWNWSLQQGITGQPIGSGTLTNLQMVYPAKNSFAMTEGAVRCEAPH
ncbi:MAG: hypothetical protein JKX85_15200 [Phycisphaeraceae bacterium]|nr:hypothetical protein [Phycisphaeraceae bacterium]